MIGLEIRNFTLLNFLEIRGGDMARNDYRGELDLKEISRIQKEFAQAIKDAFLAGFSYETNFDRVSQREVISEATIDVDVIVDHLKEMSIETRVRLSEIILNQNFTLKSLNQFEDLKLSLLIGE